MSNNAKISEAGYPQYNLPYDIDNVNALLAAGGEAQIQTSTNIIDSEFGVRDDAANRGQKENHYGIDFSLPIGSNIHAVEAGEVVRVIEEHDVFGNVVILKHDAAGENLTIYAGLQEWHVAEGEIVTQDQLIALSGALVSSIGEPIFHFESLSGNEQYEFVSAEGEYFKGTSYDFIRQGGDILGSSLQYDRINPRHVFEHLGADIFPQQILFNHDMSQAGGTAYGNNSYIGNSKNNKYYDGVGGDSVDFGSSSSSEIGGHDVYEFPDIEQIGNDEIYDHDLQGLLTIGGIEIKNATLRACVVEADDTDIYKETMWSLENGPHDLSGRAYTATRVRDGQEHEEGEDLTIAINQFVTQRENSRNSITIKNFPFERAKNASCFGMTLGGYGVEVVEEVGKVDPRVYADIAEDSAAYYDLKVEQLRDGRTVIAWRVYREFDDWQLEGWFIQFRIIESDGSLGKIKEAMAEKGTGAPSGDTSYDFCALSDGGFAVVWEDDYYERDEGFVGVLYLNRFDRFGNSARGVEKIRERVGRFNDEKIRISEVGGSGKLVILYKADALCVTEIDGDVYKEEKIVVVPEGNFNPVSGDILGFADGSYQVSYDWTDWNYDTGEFTMQTLRKIKVSASSVVGPYEEIGSLASSSRLEPKADGGYIVSWGEYLGSKTEIYGQEYDALDAIYLAKYKITENDRGIGIYPQEVKEVVGGNKLCVWSVVEGFAEGKSNNTIYGKLYSPDGAVLRDDFKVAESDWSQGAGGASIGNLGEFTIYWKSNIENSTSYEAEIIGLVYNSQGVNTGMNISDIIGREKFLKHGADSPSVISVGNDGLRANGGGGADVFQLTEYSQNDIGDYDFANGDVLSLEEFGGRRRLAPASKKLSGAGLRAQSSVINIVTRNNDQGAELEFMAENGDILGSSILAGVNSLDITEENFVGTTPLVTHQESGIGLAGASRLDYQEDQPILLPALEVKKQGDLGSDQVRVKISLSDFYGNLQLVNNVAGLTVTNDPQLSILELTGDLPAINQGLSNISFVPYDDVSEPLNCCYEVSCNGYERRHNMHLTGQGVNDAPILTSISSASTIDSGTNQVIPIGMIRDVDNAYQDLSIELYVKEDGYYKRVIGDNGNLEGFDWVGIRVSEDGEVLLDVSLPEVGHFEFLYRGGDGELFSENQVFDLAVNQGAVMIDSNSPTLETSPVPTIYTTSLSGGASSASNSDDMLLSYTAGPLAAVLGSAAIYGFWRYGKGRNQSSDNNVVELGENPMQQRSQGDVEGGDVGEKSGSHRDDLAKERASQGERFSDVPL